MSWITLTAIMDKPWKLFFWLPTRMIYWSICVKILHQLSVTCASSGPSCYSPCCKLDPVAGGDSITLGIALAGDQSLWYNNSDTGSNLLSPCGTQLTHVSTLDYFYIYLIFLALNLMYFLHYAVKLHNQLSIII